jgi:hypothetical protein
MGRAGTSPHGSRPLAHAAATGRGGKAESGRDVIYRLQLPRSARFAAGTYRYLDTAQDQVQARHKYIHRYK